ncbi:hypothetical protein Poly30_19730 [Planctomycetes bacterium Poly30]|uniref:Uncharacterized protein n=1 Tax=Saltatorellus ferox TaxID=2528018 RepID=A0A518EQU8_9BACT|nr:hypothetical protein Poly30_19730 [Planctomycetes bacterium Poly30]
MDASEVWQENKKFIITVGSGLFVFLIGTMVINSLYMGDISNIQRATSKAQRELSGEMFSASDLGMAEDENEALRKLYETARAAAEFRPRPEFMLDPSGGSAQAAYQTAQALIRDRLGDLASRKRAFLPDGLDLEMQKTRNVDALERHMHALDMLERTLVLALESGVRQVRAIEIKLDPTFQRGRGLGAIERTEVTLDCVAPSEAITRWLSLCETPLAAADSESSSLAAIRAQALPVRELDLKSSQSKKDDDVRARVTFDVVRIHEIEEADEDEG